MTVAALAGFVTYELQTLGWKAFQDLCGAILSEVLGQTFLVFAPGNDGGRDGAFRGTWKSDDGELLGPFTAQCKFTSHPHSGFSIQRMSSEFETVRRLVARSLADTYILMTNFSISGNAEAVDVLRGLGIKRPLIFGYEKICHTIQHTPRLRRLVPRVYGLGDLTEILDERAYAQASQLLVSLQDDLAKFVPTASYRLAARALQKFGFVLLLGEPAAGKSTIAATLALSGIDEWKLRPVKIESPSAFEAHWNPNDPDQFFWIDDMFGATQYQPSLADQWSRLFPYMAAAIKQSARIVATSRDYIFRQARTDIKATAFPLIAHSQVVVNIEKLTNAEKEAILYNHLKRGDQPKGFRQRLKPFLTALAHSVHFKPEMARRLGTSLFTKNLELKSATLLQFFESPEDFLLEVIASLSDDQKAALGLIFMHGGSLPRPLDLEAQDSEAITRIGSSVGGVTASLNAMRDSMVAASENEDGQWWIFKHPTISDAFSAYISDNLELIDIYIRGTSTGRLLREITCGRSVKGAKIEVPRNRYPAVIERLIPHMQDANGAADVARFLADRCSKEFLNALLSAESDIEPLVRLDSYLSLSPHAMFCSRLITEDLATLEFKAQFVAAVTRLAIETPDLDFVTDPRLSAALTIGEMTAIMRNVREQLVPHLGQMVGEWASNCDSDPETYFEPLRDVFRTLERVFGNDDEALECIASADADIDAEIESMNQARAEHESRESDDYDWRTSRESYSRLSSRETFDDVDK
jgi:energy-coupling factor transporter ATP-binding protein EcfA2